MTREEIRRAAALGGATGVLTVGAARPLALRSSAPPRSARRASAAVVFIPAQRRRPPRPFEPFEPNHGPAGHHRFRRRPGPARQPAARATANA